MLKAKSIGSILVLALATTTSLGHTREAFDKVFVQCSVAQGNGFNWASTIGWLAGTVRQLAINAGRFEGASQKRAGVDVSCFTGSSSSGYSAALLDHLLNNQNIVASDGSRGHKILTVDEANNVADALYFLARSMDFSSEEGMIAGLSIVGAKLGLDDLSNHSVPGNVWSAFVDAKAVTRMFSKWIKAADYYQPEWLAYSNNPREFVNGEVQRKKLKSIGVSNDFCVTALVVPMERAVLPLSYADLKMAFICNPSTIKKVMGRNLFSFLNSGRVMKNRFLIGSTDSWTVAQNITMREPGLTSELSGSLIRPPIGLTKVYELRENGFHGLTSKGKYLVIGGFPDARMQAWVGTVLLQKRMGELQAQGMSVAGRMAIFGKIENRSDSNDSFAQQAIVKYFTRYPIDKSWAPAAKTLNNYYSWQDDYCRALGGTGHVEIDFYRMDWNLSKQPAALTGRSRELAALGYNLAGRPAGGCR